MGDLPHSQKTRWGERTRLLLHHVRLHWSHKYWDCSFRWANTLVAGTGKNWRWLVVLCPSSNGYKWDETSTKLHGNRKFFTSLNYFDLIKRALIGNLTGFFSRNNDIFKMHSFLLYGNNNFLFYGNNNIFIIHIFLFYGNNDIFKIYSFRSWGWKTPIFSPVILYEERVPPSWQTEEHQEQQSAIS